MLRLWEDLHFQIILDYPPEGPHGRETLQVFGVWEVLQPKLTPVRPSENPQRSKAIPMSYLRGELQFQPQTSQAPEHPHERGPV